MAKRKRYKPIRLKRWKLLKVAARAHNITLALRTVGLYRLPATLRRLYTPLTETAKRQGFRSASRTRAYRRRR